MDLPAPIQVDPKNVRYRKNVLGLIESYDVVSGRVLSVQAQMRPGMPEAEMLQVEMEGQVFLVQKGIDLKRAPVPASFNQVIADILVQEIEEGKTLSKALRDLRKEDPSIPSYSTILQWAEADHAFGDRLTRARRARAEMTHDKIVEYADEMATGNLTKGQVDALNQAATLLKWSAEKSDPIRFGGGKEAADRGTTIIIQTGIDRSPVVEVTHGPERQRASVEPGRDILGVPGEPEGAGA